MAAATPLDRDEDTAVRATRTKLGPGLTTPATRAATIARSADVSSTARVDEPETG
jgi:hypothetical protein